VALQTISLSFYEALDTDDLMPGEAWATPDAVLAQARDTLEAVKMYTCTSVYEPSVPLDIALVRGLLPSVAGKISLGVWERKD
jgi:hypothetical protein